MGLTVCHTDREPLPSIPRLGRGSPALPPKAYAVDHGVEMRLGVEGGPAEGREIVVDTIGGCPPARLELNGAAYVARWFGAPPHEDADWHYCWVRG